VIKVLTFSTLFPNSERPSHGVFVETRLRELLRRGTVESLVVAPVPWFPFKSPRFGTNSVFARVPARETRHGIEVLHPRYPLLPKVGMTSAPAAMAFALRPFLRSIQKRFDFDLIDAHYFYPDGVAAALLGKWLGKPVVITARGTDLNLIPQYRLPRSMIVWAARRSAHVITVCQALKDTMVELGGAADHVTVLRNGVDLEKFKPGARATQRRSLGVEGTTLLSVGHLIERKGHHFVIEALTLLPDVRLAIVGSGPMEGALRQLAARLRVADRVGFIGPIGQHELVDWYGAADALVLASDREGMANVLLEALACGTPAIATACWGTPEVISDPVAGVLTEERTAAGIASAYRRLAAAWPERAATRAFAEQFSWDATTDGQLRVFANVLADARTASSSATTVPPL
jgi:glycosyltransferase involved in cell wall biosynthesis